mgnify:CR=1 FL=1
MRILNSNEVVKKIGWSKVTVWRMERAGLFPKRINLSDKRVGWAESKIEDWLDSRSKGICAEPVIRVE